MSPQVVQDIHRFIFETSSQLRNAGDPDKVLRHYLRATVGFMQADSGYVATIGVGDETARSVFAQPSDAPANLALVTDLLRGRQRRIPAGTLCARISRRGRPWGMMVLFIFRQAICSATSSRAPGPDHIQSAAEWSYLVS